MPLSSLLTDEESLLFTLIKSKPYKNDDVKRALSACMPLREGLRDEQGYTLLYLAVQQHQENTDIWEFLAFVEILELLLTHLNPNEACLNGATPLEACINQEEVRAYSVDIAKILLKHGADCFQNIAKAKAPLWQKALQSKDKAIQALILTHLLDHVFQESPDLRYVTPFLTRSTLLSKHINYTTLVPYNVFLSDGVTPEIIGIWMWHYHTLKHIMVENRQALLTTFKPLLSPQMAHLLPYVTSTWMSFCLSPRHREEHFRKRFIGALKRHGLKQQDIAIDLLPAVIEKLQKIDNAFRTSLALHKDTVMQSYCSPLAISQEEIAVAVFAAMTEPPHWRSFLDAMATVRKGHSLATLRFLEIVNFPIASTLASLILQGADAHIISKQKTRSLFGRHTPRSTLLEILDNDKKGEMLTLLIPLLLSANPKHSREERRRAIRALAPCRDYVTERMLAPVYKITSDTLIAPDVFTWLLAWEVAKDIVPSRFFQEMLQRNKDIACAILTFALHSDGIDLPLPVVKALLHVSLSGPDITTAQFVDHMQTTLTGKSLETLQKEEVFRIAVAKKDLTHIQQFLQDKGDINAATALGETALYIASLLHHVELIPYLLEQGANMHIPVFLYQKNKKIRFSSPLEIALNEITSAPFMNELTAQLWNATSVVSENNNRKEHEETIKASLKHFSRLLSRLPFAQVLAAHHDFIPQSQWLQATVITWLIARYAAITLHIQEVASLEKLLQQEISALSPKNLLLPLPKEELAALLDTPHAIMQDPLTFCKHMASTCYGLEWEQVQSYGAFMDAVTQGDTTLSIQYLSAGFSPFHRLCGSSPFLEAQKHHKAELLALFSAPLFFKGTESLSAIHGRHFIPFKNQPWFTDMVQKACAQQGIHLPKNVHAEEVSDWLLIAQCLKSCPGSTVQDLALEGFLVTEKETEAVRTVLTHNATSNTPLTLSLFLESMILALKAKAVTHSTENTPSLHHKMAERATPPTTAEQKAYRKLLKAAGVKNHTDWLSHDKDTQDVLITTLRSMPHPSLPHLSSWAKRVEHTKDALLPLTKIMREEIEKRQPKSQEI